MLMKLTTTNVGSISAHLYRRRTQQQETNKLYKRKETVEIGWMMFGLHVFCFELRPTFPFGCRMFLIYLFNWKNVFSPFNIFLFFFLNFEYLHAHPYRVDSYFYFFSSVLVVFFSIDNMDFMLRMRYMLIMLGAHANVGYEYELVWIFVIGIHVSNGDGRM